MKITTWNVNGLRAVLDKGIWTWVEAENPDVLCFQEIKARPEQISEAHHLKFKGYHAYWNPAERPGYSGVAAFSRSKPLSVDLGVGQDHFDVEGRVIRIRYPGFTLLNVYFPSGQRDYGRVRYKLEFYECLLGLCDQMHAADEKLIICGDFNTAHREIDLKNPKANAKTSGFLPEERAWIDHYLAHNFVDAYRELYPDRVQYTWWTYRMGAREKNIGWRLDYFMVSKALMPAVKDIVIHDSVTGSDHCPVTLELSQ